MGSIYGYCYQSGDSVFPKSWQAKLKKWNLAYGTKPNEVEDVAIYLGGCSDLLTKNSSKEGTIDSNNDYISDIDAVIYNRDEIIEKYRINCDKSDEEIIFTLVTVYGYDELKNVNGDFAGAVFDRKQNTVTLFRDHIGIRPLYYYAENFLTFSTDMRGILAFDEVPTNVNPIWVYTLFHGNYLADRHMTEYEQIKCVLPGTYLTFSLIGEKYVGNEKKYWEIGKNKISHNNFEEYKNEMSMLIKDSVKRRADVIDGKIASELSGGLDSAVVSILLNRLGRKVLCHSWSGDPNEIPYAENDERYNIQAVWDQENLVCHFSKNFSKISDESAMAKTLEKLGIADGIVDESNQYVLPPFINTVQITEASDFAVNNGAKVIFTGHGGDEGVSHRANPYEMINNHEYSYFWKLMWERTEGKKFRLLRTIKKGTASIILGYKKAHEPFCSVDFSKYLLKSFEEKYKNTKLLPFYFNSDPKEYVKLGGSRTRLDNVALQGGYNGVRYLVPFLDYRVIDYAVSIPRHLYFGRGINRYIYREAFRDILPEKMHNFQLKEDTSNRNLSKIESEKEKNSGIHLISVEEAVQNMTGELQNAGWGEILDIKKLNDMLQGKTETKEKLIFLMYNLSQLRMVDSTRENVRHCKYDE